MSKSNNPNELFSQLRALFLPYRSKLDIPHDEPHHFYANCGRPDAKGKPQFFGAVKRSGKKCVLHFMPLYTFPELVDGISQELRSRMQGKSCFNFTTIDPTQLQELTDIFSVGVARYDRAGML